MKNTLDFTKEEFKAILDKSSDLVLKQFEQVEDINGFTSHKQKEIESWFDEKLPENGMSVDDLFAFTEEKILNTATGNLGPHMYGYVVSGGNQMGIIADKLASTINQNVAKWHLAPVITEIDKRVIQWASDIIGYGSQVAGFIGSSGSAANLDGLTVARNICFKQQDIKNKGLFAMKPMVVYCSDETHNSVDKSMELLGLGLNQLRRIKTHNNFTINLNALENQIKTDLDAGLLPFCIVGNAGTVNTGAIDDLQGLSNLAKQYNLWFHIDGAYGGLAASLTSKQDLYKGIHLADSVALDFHKWLYQPFEVGCLLVKDWSLLNQSYFKEATYLDKSLEVGSGRLEFNEHHFLLSRSAKSLKVWMSIKAFGINQIKAMIQKDIDLARYLTNQIKKSHDFELVADSDLAISCFRYKGNLTDKQEIIEFNRRLIPALENDGRVFITGTKLKGEFVLRACLINHRKTKATTDYLLEVIREVGQEMV